MGLLSSYSTWTCHFSGYSCYRARVLGTWVSVVMADGLSSCGSWALAHKLSYSKACGILLDQGLNLCLLHWQADSLLLSHQGSPHKFLFFSLYISYIHSWVSYKWNHTLCIPCVWVFAQHVFNLSILHMPFFAWLYHRMFMHFLTNRHLNCLFF